MEKVEELVAANLALPIIKDLILPKLQKVISKFSLKNVDEKLVEENFAGYLSKRYEKFLIIDTLVFPNQQTLFKLLYEPLTVISENDVEKYVQIEINNYPYSFLPKYFRVIIEDTAGMGKSTITQKLFISIIEQKAGIPILIELRQINKANDFLSEIQKQLSPIGKKISVELILKLIDQGQFIFLFDGFDEISTLDREFVIKDLHKFIEKANDNYFLITSRPEESLTAFGDFKKFNIKPLSERKAFNLIKRYDGYSFKHISKDLIKKLKTSKDESFIEFLNNPFLVSLLYKAFEYKKDIPIKKPQFYRQVYDALFESHDLSKEGYFKREKYSNLHLDDFERVLRYIGYLTSIENKVEYDKDYIVNTIDKVKKHLPDLNFKSSDFLKDLLETVPLFKKDGNYIKWAHKSLQDYFSAKFIWIDSKSNQTIILRKIYDTPQISRFYNILDIFYELDSITFESTILFWIIEDFETHCNANYLEFRFLPSEVVQRRLENSFHKECVIVVTKTEDFDKLRQGPHDAEVQAYYSKKVSKFIPRSSHTTYNYFKQPKLIVQTYMNVESNTNTILKLISARIPTLAEFRQHKVHLETLVGLEEDKIYLVDDNIKNIINNSEEFDQTSDLIMSDYTINYKNAMEKLKELRETFSQKLGNEFTDW